MKAAIYEKTGPPHDVLRIAELPAPLPGPGEVRIKVSWSGINPSDVKSRAGVRTQTPPFPQIIPHSDGYGVIDEVGADVPRARIGERVWTWNAAWERPFGTAAEYCVLPQGQAVPLPQGVDLDAGACLGIPLLTAYHAVTVDGGVAGKRVLVAGGAGAVGNYAIQLAGLMGARQILSTVSGPEKAERARAAGADILLNYRTDDLLACIQEATDGEGVDRIIEVDAAANMGMDAQCLKGGGDIVVYGSGAPEIPVPFFPLIMKHARIRFFIVYTLPSHIRERAIAHVTSILEKGALRHNIAARLPLERIADAHVLVEQGRAIGNVVLEIR